VTDDDWDQVKIRLAATWPKHGWPDSTLAVWRMEVEDARCDAEDAYEGVRALSVSESRAPALADVIRAARAARARRLLASRRITDKQVEEYDALPEGVVAIVQSSNYQDVAVLMDSEAEAVERGSDPMTALPDDIAVTAILGNRNMVPRRHWPKDIEA